MISAIFYKIWNNDKLLKVSAGSVAEDLAAIKNQPNVKDTIKKLTGEMVKGPCLVLIDCNEEKTHA